MSDDSGGEVLGGSGKDSLSSSGSIFRRWYSENPPEDVVLSGFVRDLMKSFELCDENFVKILGRMKYVDEFTAKFVESIQGRMDVVEGLLGKIEERSSVEGGGSGGSGVSESSGGPAVGGLVSGVGPGGGTSSVVVEESSGSSGSS